MRGRLKELQDELLRQFYAQQKPWPPFNKTPGVLFAMLPLSATLVSLGLFDVPPQQS